MRVLKRGLFLGLFVVVAVIGTSFFSESSALRAAEPFPAQISDVTFWKMVSDMSEPDGYFRFENFLSNDLAYQYVIPRLLQTVKAGSVYMGVGPEQNFTYIAALKPKIAFIVDIGGTRTPVWRRKQSFEVARRWTWKS